METHKAWMALTAASLSLALATGCRETPEPISQVPPSPQSYEPQPLPPVTVSPPGGAGANDPYAPGPGAGYNEPEVIVPAPAPGPAGSGQTYTVRKGDTLWSIAARVYGNGQRWVDIAQANPSLDPKKMAVGQQIVLP